MSARNSAGVGAERSVTGAAAVTDDARMCGESIEAQNRERLRPAIRIHHMRLTACDDDKVALGHAELSSVFEREGR